MQKATGEKITLEQINFASSSMGNIQEQSPFENYQKFREFFIKTFLDDKEASKFLIDENHFKLVSDFKLFDSAYIDNLKLCVSIKTKCPEIYEESVKVIDAYVRPEKRNEGLNHWYQESGGLLAFILKHYEGISERQALHVAAQVTKYSISTIKKSYYERSKSLRNLAKEELPEIAILLPLYWTLYAKEIDLSKLRPYALKSIRSVSENQKVIEAYWSFTNKIKFHFERKIKPLLSNEMLTIIQSAAKELGISYPLQDKPAAIDVFYTLCITFLAESMPSVLQDIEKSLSQNS